MSVTYFVRIWTDQSSNLWSRLYGSITVSWFINVESRGFRFVFFKLCVHTLRSIFRVENILLFIFIWIFQAAHTLTFYFELITTIWKWTWAQNYQVLFWIFWRALLDVNQIIFKTLRLGETRSLHIATNFRNRKQYLLIVPAFCPLW